MIPRPCSPDKSAPNEVLHVVLSTGVLELPEADADEFQKNYFTFIQKLQIVVQNGGQRRGSTVT